MFITVFGILNSVCMVASAATSHLGQQQVIGGGKSKSWERERSVVLQVRTRRRGNVDEKLKIDGNEHKRRRVHEKERKGVLVNQYKRIYF